MSFGLGAVKFLKERSFELGLKETNPPTGDTQNREFWVVPLMAWQMPVVIVPGGEFAVALRNRPLASVAAADTLLIG